MNRTNMDYEYYLMIDAFQDYMFKSANIEKIKELCSDDLDIWPTINRTRFNSLCVDYIEAVHGKIMEI